MTLNDNRAITNFILNSAAATFSHTAGTYTVGGSMALTSGVYSLNGGTISGGSVTGVAGRLRIGTGNSVLNNVQLAAGVLDVSAANGRLALTGGTNFAPGSTYTAGPDFTLTVNQSQAINNLDWTFATPTQSNYLFVGASGLRIGSTSLFRFASTNTGGTQVSGGAIENDGQVLNSGVGVELMYIHSFTNRGVVRTTSTGQFGIDTTAGPGAFLNSSSGLVEILNGGVRIENLSNQGIIRIRGNGTLDLIGNYSTSDIGYLDRGGTPGNPGSLGFVTIRGIFNLLTDLDIHTILGPVNSGGPVGGVVVFPSTAFVMGNGHTLSSSGASRYRIYQQIVFDNVRITPDSLDLSHGELLIRNGTEFLPNSTYTLGGSLRVYQAIPIQNLTLSLNDLSAISNDQANVPTVPVDFSIGGTSAFTYTGSIGVSITVATGTTFTNGGLLASTGSGQLGLYGASVSNAGVIRSAAGTIRIQTDGFTNQATGLLDAAGGQIVVASSFFTNHIGNVLTDGTYRVSNGGTLDFPGRTVSAIGANTSVILDGPMSGFGALEWNLATLAGTLSVNNGRTLGVAPAGLTVASGGTLTGHQGTIAGNTLVQQGGQLSPGNGVGRITVAGGLDLRGTVRYDISPAGGNTNQSNGTGGTPGTSYDTIVVAPPIGNPTDPTHASVRPTANIAVVAADTDLGGAFWSVPQQWTLLRTENGLVLDDAGFPLASGTSASVGLLNRDTGGVVDYSSFGSFSYDVLITGENGAGQRELLLMWAPAPVPEPTGLLAVAAAVVGAGAAYRRYRHRTPRQ